MAPRVEVVLLNWNKSAATLACVASLQAQTYPDAHILVVDNGSEADDVAALAQVAARGAFTLLRNARNLGFTGGMNAGIARAMANGAAYVWLLNNDLTVGPDTLAGLVTAAEADPRIGLASPVIRNTDAEGVVDFCAGLVLTAPLNFDRTDDPALAARWMREYPDRIWLVGTALLLRRALVEAIGGFDDRFFAYWEDNDYCLRSLDAGFRNVVVPSVEVRHAAHASAAEPDYRPPYFQYYMNRNELLLLRKHGGVWRNARSLLWSVRRQWRLLQRRQYSPAARAAAWAGLRDGLLGRSGAWRRS